MISMIADWTQDMWSPIINLFSFIPSYGWMIIVFTIALKLVLSPLDFWQKKISRDSAKKQQKIQPKLEKLKSTYGNNQQLLNKATRELYQKEGYNVVGSCFSMLFNLVLTLFIFLTLFYALMGVSQDKIYNEYTQLNEVYETTITAELNKIDPAITDYTSANEYIVNKMNARLGEAEQAVIDSGVVKPDPSDEKKYADFLLLVEQKAFALVAEKDIPDQMTVAQNAVLVKYDEIREGWLWIDSLWRPDTYVSGFPNYKDFYNSANLRKQLPDNPVAINKIAVSYDVITANIQNKYSSWNGYFILVILAGAVTYLSFTITQMTNSKKKEKFKPVNNSVKQINGGQTTPQVDPAKGMKIMKFIMPVLMIIFTWGYSAAFALYIVTNSLMSTLLSFGSLKIFEKIDKNKEEKAKNIKKVEYSR